MQQSCYIVSLSCSYGREGAPRIQGHSNQYIQSQFLFGGWTIPLTERAGPFIEELKPFVISNEEELNEFLTGLRLFRVRGRFEALSEIDYGERVILAAYFLWRPLKGLPLSLDAVRLSEKNEVVIDLRLEDVPGREAPYLAAPFHMVSIRRALLPQDGPVNFIYLLNGNKVATIISSIE